MHTRSDIPDGYISGLSRRRENPRIAHLYKGDFSDPGQPMCRNGYEKAGDFSIWRNNIGPDGICKVCLRRAHANLDPAPWPEEN